MAVQAPPDVSRVGLAIADVISIDNRIVTPFMSSIFIVALRQKGFPKTRCVGVSSPAGQMPSVPLAVKAPGIFPLLNAAQYINRETKDCVGKGQVCLEQQMQSLRSDQRQL